VVPVVGFVAPIVIAMPTSLDIGVRHVMPVFAFLSMLAAVGVARLWNGRAAASRDSQAKPGMTRPIWVERAAVVVLSAWLVLSSALAHPDYLSYFNELGGRHPENILVISDFDWGQDLARLATYVHEQQIQHISIAYDGYYDPVALGLADSEHVLCDATPSGWIAMEVRSVRLYPECYTWLRQQSPVATVGKTELIYYVPESHSTGGSAAGQEHPTRVVAAPAAKRPIERDGQPGSSR
jgi:hypothetical protein